MPRHDVTPPPLPTGSRFVFALDALGVKTRGATVGGRLRRLFEV